MREIHLSAIRALRNAILLGNNARRFFAKQNGIEQIDHPQPTASHLVFVSRADAARGSTDFVGAASYFRRHIQFAVIWENQVGSIADVQAAFDVDTGFRQRFNFGHERRGIDDHARADDRVLVRAQDAAGDELKHIAILANDDRVASIVAAGNAHNIIKRPSQIIDNLALALVAPLRADHNDRFHAENLLARDRGGGIPASKNPPDRSLWSKIRATHQFQIVRWALGERKQVRRSQRTSAFGCTGTTGSRVDNVERQGMHRPEKANS